MTRKDDKGDQPSGGETTWTNTGATRYGRGQHKTGSFGDDMLRPSPNHGTQRLPNDDDDDVQAINCRPTCYDCLRHFLNMLFTYIANARMCSALNVAKAAVLRQFYVLYDPLRDGLSVSLLLYLFLAKTSLAEDYIGMPVNG